MLMDSDMLQCLGVLDAAMETYNMGKLIKIKVNVFRKKKDEDPFVPNPILYIFMVVDSFY